MNRQDIIEFLNVFGYEYDMKELEQALSTEKLNLKGKCVCFCRVSTDKQRTESQTAAIIDEANRNGYDDDDIILIEQKESAIKLDISERVGIQQLKEAIETNDVKVVIIYEISRISRRMDVLYSVRDYLIEKKVNLICLKPYMRLLDEQSKMTQTASILFSLFGTLSESEMMIQKERMMRGRKNKMQQGKYGGGWIAFGYKKDDQDRIVIDEVAAKVVHKIYDMYESGMSARTIAQELIELGDIPQLGRDAGQQFVTKTIQREQYVGAGKGTNYIYPQIISQEQYDRCKEIRANKSKPKTGISVQYYGHGIVYNELGRLLTPSKANNVYTSYHIDKKHTASINLNMLDSIIWHVTKEHISHNTIPNIAQQRKDIEDKLEEVKKRITALDRQIEDQTKKIERAENMVINGIMTMDRGSKYINDAKRQIDEFKLKQDELRYKENSLLNEFIYVNSFIYEMDGAKPVNLDNIVDDKERIELIRKTIKRIDAVKDETNMMGRYWLTFTFTDDKTERYKIRTTGLRKDLYDEEGNEIMFEMLNRVERKKKKR